MTPDKVPVEEFVIAAEQTTRSLPQEQKYKLWADFAGFLESPRAPKPNLPVQGRNTLKELQKEKSIIILPAGRGNIYYGDGRISREMTKLLSNKSTYEKLKKDPTKKYKALIRVFTTLGKEGKITQDQYWYLYPTLEKVPRKYGSQRSTNRLSHSSLLHTDNSIQSDQRLG